MSNTVHSKKVQSSVEIAEILSHFLRKNFVKTMVLLKKLLKSWFDEKKIQYEREFLVFPHSVLWKCNFHAHIHIVSWN